MDVQRNAVAHALVQGSPCHGDVRAFRPKLQNGIEAPGPETLRQTRVEVRLGLVLMTL
jgi:hypothetical protein